MKLEKKIERYMPLFPSESNFDLLTEMSNISRQKTGLDYIVWLFPKTGKEKHGARIKIKIDNEYKFTDAKNLSRGKQILQNKLEEFGIISNISPLWHREIPQNFITVQRYNYSNIFLIGESNQTI